jgi:hypothetical protein
MRAYNLPVSSHVIISIVYTLVAEQLKSIINFNIVAQQLKSWLDYKYRTRRVCHQDAQQGKTITEYRTPAKKGTDLVFAVYQDTEAANPDLLYADFSKSFAKTLDRSGKGEREDGNQRRRQITFIPSDDL